MSQSSFKTPKGTELPFFMVIRRSKDKATGQWKELPPQPYLQVAHRLVWFREENPNWTIETERVDGTHEYSIFKARILDESGRLRATAHKREDSAGFADHLEKAETSAIGRALALCGYGTQFAPELGEEDRLADASTPPKKEKSNPVVVPNMTPETTVDLETREVVFNAVTKDLKLTKAGAVLWISKTMKGKKSDQWTKVDVEFILKQIALEAQNVGDANEDLAMFDTR